VDHDRLIASARRWVETVVVAHQLCPFANRELQNDRVRFVVTDSTTEDKLLLALTEELRLLISDPSIETTLLIHQRVLLDFYTYNDFLQVADGLLVDMELDGIIQIASFHPTYQFSGTKPDDAENYTNRSPDPMLHLIRESSVARAIAEYPGVEHIPKRNIARLSALGASEMKALLANCSAPNTVSVAKAKRDGS
jgi:uncharacterized protein